MMKPMLLSGLFVSLVLLVANEGLIYYSKTLVAAAPQAGPGGAAQTSPASVPAGSIVIVPSLEKPKNARRLEDKDLAGYLLVYFKDQTQSAYMAVSWDGYTFKRLGTKTYVLMYDVYGARPNNMGFSETSDFVHYKNLGRFNEGVMKGTNFERPKHGAVTYLTLGELKAAAECWKVDIKLD